MDISGSLDLYSWLERQQTRSIMPTTTLPNKLIAVLLSFALVFRSHQALHLRTMKPTLKPLQKKPEVVKIAQTKTRRIHP